MKEEIWYNYKYDVLCLGEPQWGGIRLYSDLGEGWYLYDELKYYICLGDL